jgi:uncharacterized membrane protein
MWLVTTTLAATGATVAKLALPGKKYKLNMLALMLWGAAAMILVDHWLGYEGGSFIEKNTDGMITSGGLLGLVMLAPVFIIWIVAILLEKRR